MSPRSLLPLSLSLLFLLSTAAASSTPVKYCDEKADYPVEVKGVYIKPNPVVRGKITTFTIVANTGDCIKAGKLIIDVAYLGFNIHEETRDLCAEAETACPISAGDFNLSHSTTLPIFTPPADP